MTSANTPLSATDLDESAAVRYNWNLAAQLQNWIPAEPPAANVTPGSQGKIIKFGASTTSGVGASTRQSYSDELVKYLTRESGIAVQGAYFAGGQADTFATSFAGDEGCNYGIGCAGGALAQHSASGRKSSGPRGRSALATAWRAVTEMMAVGRRRRPLSIQAVPPSRKLRSLATTAT